MTYKGFTVDDELVDKYVESLDLSIAEACELILEENGKLEESEETKKAIAENSKNVHRRYEQEAKPRKKMERERKKDEEKGFLLNCVRVLIEGLKATDVKMKNEVELSFIYNDNRYTFKLTKHRPPKK